MSELTWRKSSRSGAESNCVEIRSDLGALRDSKNPAGPVLPVPASGLGALVAAVRG